MRYWDQSIVCTPRRVRPAFRQKAEHRLRTRTAFAAEISPVEQGGITRERTPPRPASTSCAWKSRSSSARSAQGREHRCEVFRHEVIRFRRSSRDWPFLEERLAQAWHSSPSRGRSPRALRQTSPDRSVSKAPWWWRVLLALPRHRSGPVPSRDPSAAFDDLR